MFSGIRTACRHLLSDLKPAGFNHYRSKFAAMEKKPFVTGGAQVEEDRSAKRSKVLKRVGTHNGTFHCDEALACYMIRLTQKFNNAEIVRTRDYKVLDTLDAVLDVGGVYDPEKDRYDHHQKGFDYDFGDGFKTKLSSAGLIYKHYGREIVSRQLGLDLDHSDVGLVYLALYKGFIEEIDAIDNGINQYDTDKPARYVNNTHLSARVSKINLDWMEDITPDEEDRAFHCAMKVVGQDFQEMLHHYAKSWLPARAIVADSIKSRNDVDPSGEIILLKRYCPWKEHIFELEQELNVETLIKYVLYQVLLSEGGEGGQRRRSGFCAGCAEDSADCWVLLEHSCDCSSDIHCPSKDNRNLAWRIQAVAVAPFQFDSRKPLPKEWRGLMDDDLAKVAGIEGCIFVHSSGFIGGNKTFDGVLEMARKSLRTR